MCADDSPGGPWPSPLHAPEPAAVIELEPVDSVIVTTLMDNVTDIFMPDQGPARRVGPGGPQRPAAVMTGGHAPDALIAEHGFSVLVTVARDGREHRFLFDAGTSPDGVVENMRRLDIAPGSIEAIVCSHGHFDHTTGIDGLIRVLGRTSLPVLIHPHFWRRRRIALPGREPLEIPTHQPPGAGRGGLRHHRGAAAELPLRPIGAGDRGGPADHRLRARVPAAAGLARRKLAARPPRSRRSGTDHQRPAGKGLVVLTGCGHAGVVNIASYASRLTGGQPLYALLGGFHLNGPLFEPLIPRVLDDLAAMNPGVLVPAHCTGWRAQHAMAARFPAAYVPNTVGTSFHL